MTWTVRRDGDAAAATRIARRDRRTLRYELPGLVDANRITVDFSPKGGPAGITGVLTPGSLFKGQMTPTAIKWPDGNSWPKTS